MGCRFRLLGEARRRRSPDKLYDAARAFRRDGAAIQMRNQAPEGSKWALLLRRLARRIVTGRIIPSHDDGGLPHAFRHHEIVERGGVRQREANAAVGDGRAEAWMV